ncbi:hypothetical protein GT037_007585, partial [Alternaria burnsii]
QLTPNRSHFVALSTYSPRSSRAFRLPTSSTIQSAHRRLSTRHLIFAEPKPTRRGHNDSEQPRLIAHEQSQGHKWSRKVWQ